MQRWTVRLGLSLMVLVGFWTNRLPAQVLVVPHAHYEPAHHVFVVPPAAYEPAHHFYGTPAFAPRLPAPPAKHGIARMFNQCGVCCGMDPFYSACGNLHYELDFWFGSCRWFFQEACPPGGCNHNYRSGHGAHAQRGTPMGLPFVPAPCFER
jgi:hypothetical protein